MNNESGGLPLEILYVEDSPYDIELTMHALKKNNLASYVYTTHDGVEALEYLFGNAEGEGNLVCRKPKLILLDLKLPRLNGLEILEKIKNNPESCTIPVVVLTSSQEEPDLEKAYNLGANSYIVKPIDYEKFIDTVANLGLYWLALNKTNGE